MRLSIVADVLGAGEVLVCEFQEVCDARVAGGGALRGEGRGLGLCLRDRAPGVDAAADLLGCGELLGGLRRAIGAIADDGYRRFSIRRDGRERMVRPQRLLFEHHTGRQLDHDTVLLRSCDVPICVHARSFTPAGVLDFSTEGGDKVGIWMLRSSRRGCRP